MVWAAETIREQMIRRLLLQNAGGADANAHAITAATLRIWERVATELEALFGIRGVRALYERSLHLARQVHPWLADSKEPAPAEDPFRALRLGLEGVERDDALAASATFLIVSTDLLYKLIGAGLTTRLIDSSWVDDTGEQARKELGNE